LAGGVPEKADVVEGVKGVKYTTILSGMYKNNKELGSFEPFFE
jgi:hypothetical protein